jgi:hypothetical protein
MGEGMVKVVVVVVKILIFFSANFMEKPTAFGS